MTEGIFAYFIGTAGSGKSTLVATMSSWFKLRGLDTVLVNLDPGAEKLPYTPDVDIRDWISLKEVMESYELGPNGAQIACADMIALNMDDVKESIESFKSDYILMDTPGQLELFVFREAGKYTVKLLHPEKSVICYLIDPALAKSASGFATQLLLSLTTNFRLNQSQINILTKTDLLTDEELESIEKWSCDSEELYGAVIAEEPSVYQQMSEGLIQLMREFGGHTQLIPTSKEKFFGVEDVYNTIQLLFEGGEDKMKD
ncbi:MAG: ATP/GTP-binding protein [Methanobacteriota archaeon]